MLKTDRDQGNDGLSNTTNLHRFIPADQFGYSLTYFTGDYTAAGSDVGGYVPFEANYSANAAMVAGNLYNGNIKHMVTAIQPIMSQTAVNNSDKPQAMIYSYDQLNRLSSAKSVNDFNTATNTWNNATPSNAFGEQLTYDRNGNIQTLKRYGGTASDLLMDDFVYNYTSGRNQLSSLKENKLTDLYANDIEGRVAAYGYTYDKIGQLLTDEYAQIAEIKWTANNKVSEIKRTAASNQEDVRFVYDPMGRRVQKTVIPKVASGSNFVAAAASTWKHTFYTYDANGNQFGMYKLVGTQLTLEDQVVYGSTRVGAVNRNIAIMNNTFVPSYLHMPGLKTYELANHLGNVLVTVGDARIAINNAGVVARYEAKSVTYSDYYPFGMQMPNRKGGSGYRYGYQGYESDGEVKGDGNSYTTEFRQFDPRIGRWLSLDPRAKKYAYSSPYVAFANNPILFADSDGDTIRIAKRNGDRNKILFRVQARVYLTALKIFSPTARKLINDIEDSPNVLTITESFSSYGVGVSESEATKTENATNGTGTNANLKMTFGRKERENFKADLKEDGALNGGGLYRLRIYAHELVHGRDYVDGTLDRTKVDGLKNSEAKAVRYENKIFKDLKLRDNDVFMYRKKYTDLPVSDWYPNKNSKFD